MGISRNQGEQNLPLTAASSACQLHSRIGHTKQISSVEEHRPRQSHDIYSILMDDLFIGVNRGIYEYRRIYCKVR